MLQTIHTVCEMLAVGLELPANTFTDLLNSGPHLLAPTGSDVGNFHELGQIFAGMRCLSCRALIILFVFFWSLMFFPSLSCAPHHIPPAGFHYDLNFLTIHGKSRFPGLYIWLRDGTRVLVRVPDGCLLLQAGNSFFLLFHLLVFSFCYCFRSSFCSLLCSLPF